MGRTDICLVVKSGKTVAEEQVEWFVKAWYSTVILLFSQISALSRAEFKRSCLLAAGAAVSEGGEARAAVRPARRMPSHIFSHGPAALTARGAPVQIWQPWEVSALCFETSFRVSG